MCGDRPVGQQFYISSPRPDTPQFASLYGRVEEGQISYEGASPLYSGAEESSAIPFMFDASCALVRVTQVRDVTRLVAP